MSVPENVTELSYLDIVGLTNDQVEDYLKKPHIDQTFSTWETNGKLPTDVKQLLRRWIVSQGVAERKALELSDVVLCRARRAGESYVRKIRESNDEPRRRRRDGNELDLKIDFNSPTRDLLDTELDKFEKGIPPGFGTNTSSSSSSNASTPPPSGVKIDEAAIAAAASAVIGPRLTQAKQELSTFCIQEVRAAAERYQLSDQMRTTIETIASTIAQEAASNYLDIIDDKHNNIIAKLENQIPKVLEVKHNGKSRKLPAEPRHKVFDEVLRALMVDEHVYLVGEAGTGKTHMFKQLGEALDQPVTVLGQTLTKYEFSGHLGPTGEYVGTLLRKAVEEGHLLAVDEIDISAAAAIAFLNTLLANRYIAFPDKIVEAHPNFKVIAAANTYGFGATSTYIGRNPLDAASLDRFTYIQCHYDEDLERTLYGDTPWTAYVHRVRKALNALNQQHIVSMRAIDRGRKLLAINEEPESVCRKALWRNLAPDVILKVKAQAGEFIIQEQEAA